MHLATASDIRPQPLLYIALASTQYGCSLSCIRLQVQYIQLNENRLSGQIPPAFGDMHALTQLLLHQNQLQGYIPTQIGLLTSLRSGLMLNNNRFSGPIPSEIGQLRNLHLLDLYGTQLQSEHMMLAAANTYRCSLCSYGYRQLSGGRPARYDRQPDQPQAVGACQNSRPGIASAVP